MNSRRKIFLFIGFFLCFQFNVVSFREINILKEEVNFLLQDINYLLSVSSFLVSTILTSYFLLLLYFL